MGSEKQTSEYLLIVRAPRYLQLLPWPRYLYAFVASIYGIAQNLAGMAKATGNKNVPKVATYIHSLSWLAGTIVAFVIYTIAGKIWPMEEKFEVGQVMDDLDASSLNHSDQDDRKVVAQDTSKGYQLCAAHELNRDEGK